MDPLTFLYFTIRPAISTLPTYLCTDPEAIVSFFFLPFFISIRCFPLQPLILILFFLTFPSLTPLTPHLFIYPSLFLTFGSPSSAASPLASKPFAMNLPFSHDGTSDGNPMTDFSAFTCSQNFCRERNLCSSGAFIASGGMCCVVHTEKRIWSDWNFQGRWENLSYFGFQLPLWHLQNSMLRHWKTAEINPQLWTVNSQFSIALSKI